MINAHLAKYILNNSSSNYKIVGKKIPLGQGYSIIALPQNKALIIAINKCLLNMETNGTYLTIYNKYFSG